ncbi:hypothetical protein IKS57_02200 [bacterium]|nr:hypothetical protein [bacterium]
MSYKVLYNFMCSSTTDTINITLPTNLNLNPNKIYYLQLYNLSYSNVWANIKTNLYISPSNSWVIDGSPVSEVVIPAGSLLSLESIYEKIKTATGDKLELSINENAKCQIDFNGVSTISIAAADLGILNTFFCGDISTAITSPLNPVISPNMPKVSDFNKLILNCSFCNPSTYINYANKVNTSTSVLSISSNGKPFEYIEYVSRVNLLYPINLSNIQNIYINMADEKNEKLYQVPNTSSDLYVWLSINETI